MRTGITRVPIAVDARVPSGHTSAYVVGEADALVVDPARRTSALDDVLAERTVGAVAVTHHHADHVGGAAAYAREFDATVWARAGREADFERATGESPDRTFREGTAIPVDDGAVTVLETPGHAPEHVAFAAGTETKGEEAVLAGDLAVAEGSVAVTAPAGDVRAYLTSLRRIHARDPDLLYPAHGPRIDDPQAVCERLIAHRLDRERRVFEAVRAGRETVDAVLDDAYDRDLSGVRSLARGTVRAHLEKLAVEGRVDWDGERAVPR